MHAINIFYRFVDISSTGLEFTNTMESCLRLSSVALTDCCLPESYIRRNWLIYKFLDDKISLCSLG